MKLLKKIIKISLISIALLVILAKVSLFLHERSGVDKTPHEKFENLGYVVDFTKKTTENESPPTVILISGSGGGFWGKRRKEHITALLENGYNVVRIAYFKIEGLSNTLERIEIEPFSRILQHIKGKHPQLDIDNVAIIGISKGTELVLNVASRLKQYKAVVAIVPTFVTFQGNEIGGESDPHPSFQLSGKELPYVPLPSSTFLGYETIWSGEINLFNAGLMNNPKRVEQARIPVENINAPILLISGKYDQIWPSFLMATEIEKRLLEKNYGHEVLHKPMNNNHFVLRDETSWKHVMIFLEKHIKNKRLD